MVGRELDSYGNVIPPSYDSETSYGFNIPTSVKLILFMTVSFLLVLGVVALVVS